MRWVSGDQVNVDNLLVRHLN